MKKILVLAIALFHVAAYASNTKEDQMYHNMKTMSMGMFAQQIPLMKQARECFAKADSTKEALQCSELMGAEDSDNSTDDIKEWNNQVKEELLKEIDKGIKEIEATKKCMEQESTFQGYKVCAQQADRYV